MAELVDARNYVDPVDFEKQMKYGIRINKNDGTTEYAYAAQGGRIGASDDVTDTALFVQKESAVKALKQARKNGYESQQNCVLDVVGIEYTVAEVTEVPHPPKKSGFVLAAIKHNRWNGRSDPVWFSGPKKTGSHINWDYAVESATVFPSDVDAQAKLAECREAHEESIRRTEAEIARGYRGYSDPREKLSWEKRTKEELDEQIAHRAWFDTIRIETA